jgi:hypothetical protein
METRTNPAAPLANLEWRARHTQRVKSGCSFIDATPTPCRLKLSKCRSRSVRLQDGDEQSSEQGRHRWSAGRGRRREGE